jgi:wyosine [tRNA(Phe)-imidazoG37] synthetase (radical SAM superfamily)
MKTIFGPIRSRRFGVSLGIDLSPAFKQCNFDCLYCELAPSATVGRQSETVPVGTIVEELQEALRQHAGIDVITVTANGEPTLYPHLGELLERIDAIKGETETLILTNSATLTDQKTFEILLRFDQVKLSLDAVTPEVFKKIDRPYEGIAIEKIVDAVVAFSEAYKGKLFVEVLFVRGLNDTPEEIAALNDVLLRIDCDRIDIGTIDRPPAYPVEGVSYGELHRIATQFDATLPIHIASRVHAESCASSYSEEEIVNTLDKRPLTFEDIGLLFDEPSKKRLQKLIDEGAITESERSGLTFLVPADNVERKRRKS